MKLVLAVAVGGAVGAVTRFWIANQLIRLVGTEFPLGTILVNILGSFILGILFEPISTKWGSMREIHSFFVVGILGGFTTFSAFCLDAVLLYEKDQLISALIYVFISVLGSLLGLVSGLLLYRQVLT